jgi:hypothetical protein
MTGGAAFVWTGAEAWPAGWRAEFARVEMRDEAMTATGIQLGVDPVPYRLDYRLDATGRGFITRALHVEATGADWQRSLHLQRSVDGDWTIDAAASGDLEMPGPGGESDALAAALDCDLGFSPLTNAMPIRRHALHRRDGEVDFLMAWVSVPDLSVEALAQRYTHLRVQQDGAVVRYESVEDGDVVFSSDLEVDADGIVRLYPKLARRIS